MLPGRVSNPGPLTYESGALPIALRGPAIKATVLSFCLKNVRAFTVQMLHKLFGETRPVSHGSALAITKNFNVKL